MPSELKTGNWLDTLSSKVELKLFLFNSKAMPLTNYVCFKLFKKELSDKELTWTTT